MGERPGVGPSFDVRLPVAYAAWPDAHEQRSVAARTPTLQRPPWDLITIGKLTLGQENFRRFCYSGRRHREHPRLAGTVPALLDTLLITHYLPRQSTEIDQFSVPKS